MNARRCDIAILGGGLAGGLIALALARYRPDLSLLIVEQDTRLGGNHVWSFFETDADPEATELLRPMLAATWTHYNVHFPRHSRKLHTNYSAMTSERFDAVLREALRPEAILSGQAVKACSETEVMLGDGTLVSAGGVIDTRGLRNVSHLTGGWQKFVGRKFRLKAPHGLERPIVMDATVEQVDGYRFMYALPFADDIVFLEDTYYSDDSTLDRPLIERRIDAYLAARGWEVEELINEEYGVLPVVAGGDFAKFWRDGGDETARAGSRAGLFHSLTSYSVPDAVRFALALAHHDAFDGASLKAFSEKWAKGHWENQSYYRMLSALLFGGAYPEERLRILERFYTLNPQLIERFYSGRSTRFDKFRILAGIPPIPIPRALGTITGLGRQPAPLNFSGV
ncbi:MAG: lycopene beta-cyclase CrtY [Novosphingobium sp.]|uniref:lycopene beta-cyclase CrtY n=1 Tax=Novosphingobium sp. TaxID=1874826 RepID=UPI00301AA84E